MPGTGWARRRSPGRRPAGSRDVAEFLLDNGADPDARSQPGGTALEQAVAGGHMAVIQLLVARGATPGDALGRPPLTKDQLKDPKKVAAGRRPCGRPGRKSTRRPRQGDVKKVAALLDLSPALLNLREAGGVRSRTPLEAAVECGSKDVVALLLDRGAEFKRGYYVSEGSPLNRAIARGNKEIVELLIDKGAAVNPERVGSEKAAPLRGGAGEAGDDRAADRQRGRRERRQLAGRDAAPGRGRAGDVETAKALLRTGRT